MMDEDETDSMAGVNNHNPSVVFSTMIKFDFSYITSSWFGRVKLAQFIVCMLAGCILPSAVPAFFTRFSFYTFVIWTSFMYITIDLAIHVTSLSKLLPDCCRASDLMMYPLFIGSLALLVSCSLVASVSELYYMGGGGAYGNSYTVRTGFSAALGFILMLLFLVEAFLYYRRARNGGEERRSRKSSQDSDFENGNLRGGRNIVISRPLVKNTADHPPPYDNFKKGDNKGGAAIPIGSYGGD